MKIIECDSWNFPRHTREREVVLPMQEEQRDLFQAVRKWWRK